jgi:hypothetical protein
MAVAKPGLLALLQDKLCLEGANQRERAAQLFDDCIAVLRQGTETETILQVSRCMP